MTFRGTLYRVLLTVWLMVGASCLDATQSEMEDSAPHAPLATAERSRLDLVALDERAHTYALRYTPGIDSIRPRAFEVYLDHPGLSLISAEGGDALEVAGKELVVQTKGESRLRLVGLSRSNVTEVEAGTLANLQFRRVGTAPVTLTILTDRPVFAPLAANAGLLIGERSNP